MNKAHPTLYRRSWVQISSLRQGEDFQIELEFSFRQFSNWIGIQITSFPDIKSTNCFILMCVCLCDPTKSKPLQDYKHYLQQYKIFANIIKYITYYTYFLQFVQQYDVYNTQASSPSYRTFRRTPLALRKLYHYRINA